MAEKVAKLGVKREKDFMYYVKDGEVWKVQRKQPGVPKGRPEKVIDGGFDGRPLDLEEENGEQHVYLARKKHNRMKRGTTRRVA